MILKLNIWMFLVFLSLTQCERFDIRVCRDETDCATYETCRRLCNFRGECQNMCVTSSVKARILQRRSHDVPSTNAPLSAPYEDDLKTGDPFTVTGDPFTSDEFVKRNNDDEVTPRTFSEEDFERELRESGISASSPEPPPITSSLAFSDTAVEAFPPSLVPEAPGYEEFESGYTKTPRPSEDRKYPEEKASLDVSSTTIEQLTTEEPSTAINPESTSVESSSFPELASTRAWFFKSTFAPALGVERENQIKESGYLPEDTFYGTSKEASSSEVSTPQNAFVEGPIDKSAYFGGVTVSSLPELYGSKTASTLFGEDGLAKDNLGMTGLTESTTVASLVHSTSVELSRATTESTTGTSTKAAQKYEAEKLAVEQEKKECPAPIPCQENCAIFIDENGCQGCQCLWRSLPCDYDSECVGEGLFCEEGRCNCQRGYVQDFHVSGVCKSNATSGGFKEDNDINDSAVDKSDVKSSERDYYSRRVRKSAFKPRRMERLQWPGVVVS
ncbi:hypothetical protein L596_015188 [Steinernema carpocapsae]|uniref:TIL domain-containing protein n=1 Tax=Steinernema carpocapsae TaxID=34508 RepID=A0A4U5NF41_STECR|nr:hypothetical protein L596_015188 [Steinernema carpocapsae]